MKLNPKFRILIRYLTLLLIILLSPLFYKILIPLTLHPTTLLLKIFFNNIIYNQDTIIINQITLIKIIPACTALSAYLLLIILNLTTPIKKLKTRIYSLTFSILSLLILNILRISTLSILKYNNLPFFDITHKIFWYFLSTIFVILIWFLTIKIFSIKEIPIYSDVKQLIKNIH